VNSVDAIMQNGLIKSNSRVFIRKVRIAIILVEGIQLFQQVDQ
jgi:hypothetical protein